MRDGAVVGALLSAPLVAASYLGWKLGALPFVPFDLFDWIARELPGSVVTIGIDSAVTILRALHVGNTAAAAKTAEQTMAIAVFFAAGVVSGSVLFGVLRLSDEPALLFGTILGALIGGSALLIEQRLHRIDSFVDLSWILGMFLVWGVAFGWVYDRLREANDDPTGSRPAAIGRVERRGFLVRVAWVAGIPTLLTAAWGLVTSGRRAGAVGARWSDGHPLPNAGALVTPVPGTRPEFTPLENHYRVDADTRAPVINEHRWRLKIGGLVDHPLELTLDDLRREEPLHQFVTLSCISNPIGGDLIGTTRWSGVSLQQLLRRFELRPGATHLRITSADGFFEVVSLQTIENDPRVMLTYAWDGVPLLLEHGFPLRIYVPDVYGMKQPKWIEAIDVIDRWEPGYWVVRGWDRKGRMNATSVVDAVDVGTTPPDASGRRLASVGGIAHAGARRISRVEVRVDDGEWRDARLRDPFSEMTWVVWRADLPSDAGDPIVTVRSYEGDGTSQTGPLHSKRAKKTAFFLAVALIVSPPRAAFCQAAADVEAAEQTPVTPPLTADAYAPPSGAQRGDWVVDGTIGRRSLFAVGPLATVWQTGFNMPPEWGRLGIAKRYAEREADVAISNTLEAGLGALWGEDPRYIRSGRKGIWPRARYAIKTVVLAQRRDGSLKPAWARYGGNVMNNLIENTWLPPSMTTGRETAWRSGLGLLGRLGANAWEEFWPDVARHFKKK